ATFPASAKWWFRQRESAQRQEPFHSHVYARRRVEPGRMAKGGAMTDNSTRQSVVDRPSISVRVFAHELKPVYSGDSEMPVVLPPKGRDLRLDFFRGVANWWIFLDHIPHNIVNWITPRHYGFSDAADLFVFISGYTASFVFARMMLER